MIFYILTIKTISLKANIQWAVNISIISILIIIFFWILSTSFNYNLLKAFAILAFSAVSMILLSEKEELVLVKQYINELRKRL
jgi:hypothetical protein